MHVYISSLQSYWNRKKNLVGRQTVWCSKFYTEIVLKTGEIVFRSERRQTGKRCLGSNASDLFFGIGSQRRRSDQLAVREWMFATASRSAIEILVYMLLLDQLTKKHVYVFKQFSGAAYDNIRQSSAVLIGPRCLISCFSDLAVLLVLRRRFHWESIRCDGHEI